MNRITTTSEYLLVFLVILEFNTPYSIIPFVKVIQVSQVNRKPSSWDIKGAQGFPHIAENE